LRQKLVKAHRLFIETLMFVLDTWIVLVPKAKPHAERVLVVRLDAIGDFLLWADAAKEIVRHYRSQGRTVTLLANSLWASLAKNLAIFDEVIELDRKRFEYRMLYRWQIEYKVRMSGYGVAVHPAFSREWLNGDSVIRTCGAAERIGSLGDTSNIRSWQKRISDHWYSSLLDVDPSPRMELARNADFVRTLCNSDFQPRVFNLGDKATLDLDAPSASAIRAYRPYYILFPGAGWNARKWPVANFAQIARQLSAKTGWHGVVCGGEADRALGDVLTGMCGGQILNWAGRTDVSQLAAILSSAQFLLTNETSAAHIAAACGVPTICILGGGHYGRFMPYDVEHVDGRPLPHAVVHSMPCFGCNWNCIYEYSNGCPVPCIEKIGVNEVWEATIEMLGLTV
jgi:ADP-heptose:LPS heptosyltransferase